MAANSFLRIFVPQNRLFFDLFDSIGENIVQIGALLQKFVSEPDFDRRNSIVAELSKVEEENDTLTHTLFTELSKNFITPFDREDIHALGGALDDIADYIYGSAKKMNFYQVNPNDIGIQKMTALIEESVKHVKLAVQGLRTLKNGAGVREQLIKINDLENQSDDVFDLSIVELYNTEPDAKEVMKRREIFQSLENATDSCEEVSRVIESILIKYA
jgi:predicted phosphate transport protein (TIGR00153 family)